MSWSWWLPLGLFLGGFIVGHYLRWLIGRQGLSIPTRQKCGISHCINGQRDPRCQGENCTRCCKAYCRPQCSTLEEALEGVNRQIKELMR